jgi:6-phospho-3-hexuloisomerase
MSVMIDLIGFSISVKEKTMKENYYQHIIHELSGTLSMLDEKSIDQLIDMIINSKRIFLAGCGRSGLMIKCFAMRLMQMGFITFVVGETTTPGISEGDLLIIGSGSGETESLSLFAKSARNQKARIGLITIFSESTVGYLADVKIIINAPTSKNKKENAVSSIQPMGSLFEQSLILLLDGVILKLMDKKKLDSQSMWHNHANLE